jgi:hypothetical protein
MLFEIRKNNHGRILQRGKERILTVPLLMLDDKTIANSV